MKCRTFKIELDDDAAERSAEIKLDKFLEHLNVFQISTALVNNQYWSVLVFYSDNLPAEISNSKVLIEPFEAIAPPRSPAEKLSKLPAAPAEPIVLTTDEENIYAALRAWRNEHSSRDGLPPYIIAHNDSLMLMAKSNPQTHEDLMQVKGFGEKRAQKYGDEILQIIGGAKNESI